MVLEGQGQGQFRGNNNSFCFRFSRHVSIALQQIFPQDVNEKHTTSLFAPAAIRRFANVASSTEELSISNLPMIVEALTTCNDRGLRPSTPLLLGAVGGEGGTPLAGAAATTFGALN